MNATKPASQHPRPLEERLQRIRERMQLRDFNSSGVPGRAFVPRSADIGKAPQSSK